MSKCKTPLSHCKPPPEDETVYNLVLTEVTVFDCQIPMPSSFASLLPTVVEDVEHCVVLDTGEKGTLCSRDGNLYVCLEHTTVAIEGACVVVTLIDKPTCPDIPEPVVTIVKHEYEYNAKRVNPCE